MTKLKYILTLILTGGLLLGFGLWWILKPADVYSDSERRPLTQAPSLTAQTVFSGDFMASFENYALDQFPLRDRFRGLKATASFSLLHQLDNNGIYQVNDSVSRLDTVLQEDLVQHSLDTILAIRDVYLDDCTVYLAVIPDKNYYLAEPNGYPSLDYDALYDQIDQSGLTRIPLEDCLSAKSYYRTDTHWKQEAILPVAETLAAAIGTNVTVDYEARTLDVPFYGVYCGQSALHLEPDTIRYLTNDTLESCTVTSYATGAAKPALLYNTEKAAGKDAYDFFLQGTEPLLVIENPNAVTDRELILFRDSFGSSLAPLLIEGYAKITLVDLRYLQPEILGQYITFDGQDVLFLYSTLILNSTALK